MHIHPSCWITLEFTSWLCKSSWACLSLYNELRRILSENICLIEVRREPRWKLHDKDAYSYHLQNVQAVFIQCRCTRQTQSKTRVQFFYFFFANANSFLNSWKYKCRQIARCLELMHSFCHSPYAGNSMPILEKHDRYWYTRHRYSRCVTHS